MSSLWVPIGVTSRHNAVAACVVLNTYGLLVVGALSLAIYLEIFSTLLWLMLPLLIVFPHTGALRLGRHLTLISLAGIIPVGIVLLETPINFCLDQESAGDEVVLLSHQSAERSLPFPSSPILRRVAWHCLSAISGGTLKG